MKLDPKTVKFYPPFLDLGLFRPPVRFGGKGSTLQLQETALVIEGNLLKVSLIGLERFFKAALSEWSALTVPYSRILRVKVHRFPLLRLIGVLLLVIGVCLTGIYLDNPGRAPLPIEMLLTGVVVGILGTLLMIMIRPRLSLKFRRADGSKTTLVVSIGSKRRRTEFIRKLDEYRRGSADYARSRPTRSSGVAAADGREGEFDFTTLARGSRRAEPPSGGEHAAAAIRRGLYLSLGVSALAIIADYAVGWGESLHRFFGFVQPCLLAEAVGPASGLGGRFVMVLEWVAIPLALLPFLSRPSTRVRWLLASFAILRLGEAILGGYRVANAPPWSREDLLVYSVVLLVASAVIHAWWLRALTAGNSREEAPE